MTTGRINQVTVQALDSPPRWKASEFRFGSATVDVESDATGTTRVDLPSLPCSPDLTRLRKSVPMSGVGHRSPPSMRTTSDRRRVSRSRRILAWLTATGLAIGDQSTPFALCRMRSHSDLGVGPQISRGSATSGPSRSSQSVHPYCGGTSMTGLA